MQYNPVAGAAASFDAADMDVVDIARPAAARNQGYLFIYLFILC